MVPSLVKPILRPFLPLGLRAMAGIERRLLRREVVLPQPPIFIIGPPRSGTTLLYQVLIHAFCFSYLSNIAEGFSRSPVLVTRLFRRTILTHRTDYASNHGRTNGPGGPSEGGALWYRWFPREPGFADEYTLRPQDKRDCYRTVAGMARALGGPFLNKNVMHSLRMRALKDIFPGCLFLQMQRDRLAAACSIMGARLRDGVPEDGWWSVKPRRYEEIRHRSPAEQVCDQLYWVERDIEEDAQVIGPRRVLKVSYERLCDSPADIMVEILGFLGRFGLELDPRNPIPERFTVSGGPDIPQDLRAAIEREIALRYPASVGSEKTQDA